MGFMENKFEKIKYDINHLLFDEVDFSDRSFAQFDGGAQGELYLMRAQLKLLLSDPSMLSDMARAQALLPGGAKGPPLFRTLLLSSANCFLFFPASEAKCSALLHTLDQMQQALPVYTGPYGAHLCIQVKSELLYFSGRHQEALALAQPLMDDLKAQGDTLRAMMAGYVVIRCQMALGQIDALREIIFDLYHWSKEGPRHKEVYTVIRLWLNVTTGWSGDSPRYHVVPDGTILPVLEDRIAAVYQGIGAPFASETALVRLAEGWGASDLTMRALFMKLYQVVVAFHTATQPLSQPTVVEVLQIIRDTGLISPLIEYGMQIAPMLQAALEESLFDPPWLHEMIHRANLYEEHICQFRDEH